MERRILGKVKEKAVALVVRRGETGQAAPADQVISPKPAASNVCARTGAVNGV